MIPLWSFKSQGEHSSYHSLQADTVQHHSALKRVLWDQVIVRHQGSSQPLLCGGAEDRAGHSGLASSR